MRREQNLALIGAVLSGAVIATGLLLLLVSRVNPDNGGRMRAALLDVVTPVWQVVRAPVDGAARAIGWSGDYLGAVSSNRRLHTELIAARVELQRAAADRRALQQLRRLMAVRDPARAAIATARIVSATNGSVVRSAVIAAGRGDGVGSGLPVRTADGLIGRTLEAGDRATRILLLTDPASRVPVTVVRTGQPALAVGANAPLIEIRDRVGADAPLRRGDRLVTSGEGGIYPPGVPVGVIVDAASEPPRARLAASVIGAGYVTVEQAYMALPAAPAPVSAAPVPIEARRRSAPAAR